MCSSALSRPGVPLASVCRVYCGLDGAALASGLLKQVEVVFHLAAMSKVGPSLGDPSMVDVCIGTNVQVALLNQNGCAVARLVARLVSSWRWLTSAAESGQGTANVLRATLTARDTGAASPSVRVLYAGSSTAYGATSSVS